LESVWAAGGAAPVTGALGSGVAAAPPWGSLPARVSTAPGATRATCSSSAASAASPASPSSASAGSASARAAGASPAEPIAEATRQCGPGQGTRRSRVHRTHRYCDGGARRLALIAIVRTARLGLGQGCRGSASSVRALGHGGSARLYAFRLGNLGVGSDITGLLPCRILRRQLGDLLSLGHRQDVRQLPVGSQLLLKGSELCVLQRQQPLQGFHLAFQIAQTTGQFIAGLFGGIQLLTGLIQRVAQITAAAGGRSVFRAV